MGVLHTQSSRALRLLCAAGLLLSVSSTSIYNYYPKLNEITDKASSADQSPWREGVNDTDTDSTCDSEWGCEDEYSWSLSVVMCILLMCIFAVYMVLCFKLDYLPESVAVIVVGALVGGTQDIF